MAYRFNHMGLTVANIDRSLDFYCGTLGLPYPHAEHIFYIDGTWLGELVGTADPSIRVAFVPLDYGVLELLEYHRPDTGKPQASLRNWDVGAAHIALNIDDIDAFYTAHQDTLAFNSAPQRVVGGPWAGAKVVYLLDPDGNSVELVES